MELILTQKNLSDTEAKKFKEYTEKKVSQFEGLFEAYDSDSVSLKVNIEKFEKHDAFSVDMTLSMPRSENLVASEASHLLTKALDLSKDRLVAQIKKIKELKRENRTHKSIRQDIHQVHLETAEINK
ncbi:MAG: HPF/RaiA family ribosome-associated protein [Candidatus Gracilibacteria bacterium]|jgi:ribosomal subunit interface protein|nr:HPF/RaiA family ribosome-associated protein [Candidatus Gracilibacteria bacterium]